MENLTKMDDLGVPYFRKPPYVANAMFIWNMMNNPWDLSRYAEKHHGRPAGWETTLALPPGQWGTPNRPVVMDDHW